MDTRAMAAKMDTALGGGGIFATISNILGLTEVAEDEIGRAQRRHRAQADTLWHAFTLLTPTGDMSALAPFVYESHARELLARVVAGQDTRPGTAAEVCLACRTASAVAPLTDTAAGLYGRMWAAAGFPGDQFDMRQEHHEALSSSLIDDLEREARRKTAVADRKLGAIECRGMHHGKTVACKYARPVVPVQLELAAAS